MPILSLSRCCLKFRVLEKLKKRVDQFELLSNRTATKMKNVLSGDNKTCTKLLHPCGHDTQTLLYTIDLSYRKQRCNALHHIYIILVHVHRRIRKNFFIFSTYICSAAAAAAIISFYGGSYKPGVPMSITILYIVKSKYRFSI